MKVDEKITLDDNTEYLLLMELSYDSNKYFLAVELEKEIPTDHYEIFKEVKDGNDFLVEEVEDQELRDKLLNDFESQYDEMDDED